MNPPQSGPTLERFTKPKCRVATWFFSHHNSSSDIFDRPKVDGEKEDDEDKDPDERGGQVGAEQVHEDGEEAEEQVEEGHKRVRKC